MPRKSVKASLMEELEQKKVELSLKALLRHLSDSESSEESSSSSGITRTLDEITEMAIDSAMDTLSTARHAFHPKNRSGTDQSVFIRDLHDEETGKQLPWLS